MNCTAFPISTLILGLAAGAGAQTTPATGLPHGLAVGRVPIHTAAADGGQEYGVWAAADAYKVAFHGDMTFVPYLGSAYPENLPLTWRTQGVTLGSAQVLAGAGGDTRRHGDFRYERCLGAVTETYDVLDQGLEQSFVVHERPAGQGDLVVYGRITTALHAEPIADQHQAITFTDQHGQPVIRYGAATAIDAHGRDVEALTSYRDGEVQLRVPAEWIATATFPVTIDPLLTRATLSVGAAPSTIDIVRDDTGNDLMVVITRGVSASDQDLLAIMMNDNWSGGATVFTDVNTWNTPIAHVAAAASPQKYCLVFERQLPQRRVRAHLHASGDFTLGTAVISLEPTGAGAHDWRPDVGGQLLSNSGFTPTGSKFLIVFQRDVTGSTTFQNTIASSIFGRTLDADGTLGTEFPIAIGFLTTADHEWPSVNQQGRRIGSVGARSDWLVVFQRYIGTDATWRTRGKLVRDDGTVSAETWSPSNDGPDRHRLTPRVAGHSGRYLVSCVESPFSAVPFKTTATTGHSLRAERVDWPAGGAPTNHAERILDSQGSARLELGDAAYDGNTASHWAVTYHSARAAAGSGRALILRLGYQGLSTESQVLYDPASSSEQGVAGGVCFDSDGDDFAAAFGRITNTSGQVYGNRLAYRTPLPAATSGVSCSSAVISWAGSQQIGSELGSVRLGSAPASVAAFAVLSQSPSDLNLSFLGMNGCRLLVDASGPGYLATLNTVTSVAGNAAIPLPLPETLPAATVFFQWFHVDLGANPLNLVSTPRLRVDLVR